MEIKQMIVLEVKKGEFTFSFAMPTGSTYGTAIDAAHEILTGVIKLAQDNADRTKPVETEME